MTENDIAGSGDASQGEAIAANAQIALAEIAALLEASKTAAASIAENQRLSVAALAEAQAKVGDIVSAATSATAAKAQITDEQAVIAKKSDHIENARKHADDVRTELDRVLTAANQNATEAEGLRARAQSSSDAAAEILVASRTSKGAMRHRGRGDRCD